MIPLYFLAIVLHQMITEISLSVQKHWHLWIEICGFLKVIKSVVTLFLE